MYIFKSVQTLFALKIAWDWVKHFFHFQGRGRRKAPKYIPEYKHNLEYTNTVMGNQLKNFS